MPSKRSTKIKVPFILLVTIGKRFYAPNFEKVGGGGHIGLGLSVCMYVFMFEISSRNFMYGFLMEKIADAYFWFSLNYLP